MEITIYHATSFTGDNAKGNPAGVCVYTGELSPEKMLSVAQQLKYPVTAFIQKTDGPNYAVRYFTVTTEINACGHASLASGKVILDAEQLTSATLTTAKGVTITITRKDEQIWLEYPAYEMQPHTVNYELSNSLNLRQYLTAGYCKELGCLFIETEPTILRTLQPDIERMEDADYTIEEVVITSVSDDPAYDYLLRSFCPWIGIDEDPATGSVHTVLAGYWQQRLGKDKLKAYQASKEGGEINVKALGNKVLIGGNVSIQRKEETAV